MVNKGGTWKKDNYAFSTKMKTNQNGTWKSISQLKINKGGTWKSYS